MKRRFTFNIGGIHPPSYKSLTSKKDSHTASIPHLVTVPLSQHVGAPAECLVKKGDEVKEAMLIGKAAGFVSSNIHSPVPGEVVDIKTIYLPNGRTSQAVVIEVKGAFDRLGRKSSTREWQHRSADDLMNIIKEKGIVGMGGAAFPSQVKFAVPPSKKIDHLIINGAECEAYLTADHRLMLEKAEEIISGVLIVEKIVKSGNICIGVEENKKDAITALREATSGMKAPVTVYPLKVRYPQGDEKQLVQAITGREIPSGKLPLDAGCVVSNVGTVFAVFEGVVYDKPVIERLVTVSGGAVRYPSTLKVRIGTPIKSLIDECGGLKKKAVKIVVGGPMMGFTIYDMDTPVTKGTSGVLALTSMEVNDASTTSCLQCGRCIGACPMGLNPTTLYKMIDHQSYEDAGENGLMDCRECGSCSFVCPARIPLVQGFRVGKKILNNRKKR